MFATKSGQTVTVRSRPLVDGKDTVLLSYKEESAATHSRNAWEERPPSISLSPDGLSFVFSSVWGLSVHEIADGTNKTLIRRAPSADEGEPASWSPEVAEETYGLHSPQWSSDGRYISFEMSHYEGSEYGFFDVRDGTFFMQNKLPYSYVAPSLGAMTWSPLGATTIVPANAVDEERLDEAYLSTLDDPVHGSRVEFGEPGHLSAARLSPDLQAIALVYSAKDEWIWCGQRLLVARRDGSDVRVVDDKGEKTSIEYDLNGNLWWVEEGRLIKWDGSEESEIGMLDGDLQWTILSADGPQVQLAGYSASLKRAEFVLLDASSGKVLSKTDTDTDFTTFLGLV